MSNIRTYFENTEYSLKLHVGPTFASPGPILFIHAITAVTVVSKLKLSRLIRSIDNVTIAVYAIMNTFTPLIVGSVIVFFVELYYLD